MLGLLIHLNYFQQRSNQFSLILQLENLFTTINGNFRFTTPFSIRISSNDDKHFDVVDKIFRLRLASEYFDGLRLEPLGHTFNSSLRGITSCFSGRTLGSFNSFIAPRIRVSSLEISCRGLSFFLPLRVPLFKLRKYDSTSPFVPGILLCEGTTASMTHWDHSGIT